MMTSSIEQVEILYEIAMAIGAHDDLMPMLKESISVILRKLNCSAGCVHFLPSDRILGLPEGEHIELNLPATFTLPRNIAGNKVYQSALNHLPHAADTGQWAEFFRQPPLTGHSDAVATYHVFGLRDVGALILIKSGNGLDQVMLKSLVPLMNKLARSAKFRIHSAAMRLSEDKYRTIFESSGSALMFIEEDMTISLMNRAMERLTGLTKTDVEGKRRWTDFVANPVVLEQIKENHAARHSNPNAAEPTYEFQGISHSGLIMDLVTTVAMIPGTRQSLAALIDITEQKRMQKQLVQSQKMESIGTLAGGIAHDFSNVLTSIKLFAHLIAKNPQNTDNVAEYIKIIDSSAEQGKHIVTQLLSYAKPGEKDFAQVSLNDIIENTVTMLGRLIPKGIVLEQDLEPTLPDVAGDASKLQQIFMNLILNAKDAIPSEKGTITITTGTAYLDANSIATASDMKPGLYVTATCTDTGTGMSEDTLSSIFEPFYTTKKNGNGLGLTIISRLIRHHGGYITVSSTPGKGTAFVIYLPESCGRNSAS